MKNLYSLLILAFFWMFLDLPSYAQSDEKEALKINTELPTGLWKKDGTINVKINYGIPPYSVYISEAPNIPSDISDLIDMKEHINNDTWVFNDLKRGIYYIFVKDGNNMTEFIQVNLDKSNKL